MSLSKRLTELATRLGAEMHTRISASHPGVAAAWGALAWNGYYLALLGGHNVRAVERLRRGHYRICFQTPMQHDVYCCVAGSYAGGRFGRRITAIDRNRYEVELICRNALGLRVDSIDINLMVFQ